MIRKANKYIVVCQQMLCSPGEAIRIHYGWDGNEFGSRKTAIKHGFSVRGSDDFNIGVVVQGRRLLSFDWMHDPVGEDDESMEEIAEALGLEYEPAKERANTSEGE